MNSMHKREHFTRAVLEGVACGLSQILDVMREKQQIEELRIIGGGAKSKLWKQILADVCNVTLHDVSTFSDSATSLGAAAAAGAAPVPTCAIRSFSIRIHAFFRMQISPCALPPRAEVPCGVASIPMLVISVLFIACSFPGQHSSCAKACSTTALSAT